MCRSQDFDRDSRYQKVKELYLAANELVERGNDMILLQTCFDNAPGAGEDMISDFWLRRFFFREVAPVATLRGRNMASLQHFL